MASKSKSVLKMIARFTPYARPEARYYAAALLAAPLSTVLMIAQPYLLKTAIDTAIIPKDAALLLQIAWTYLAVVILGFITEAAYTLSISYGAMHTISRLRRHVFEHTLSLSRAFFDGQPTGKLLTRVTSDIDALGETLTAGAITIVLDVLLIVGILAAMFSMDARLTLVLLGISPVLAVAVDGIRRVLRRLFLEVRTALSTLNAYLAERITGLTVVQLYSDERRTQAEFNQLLHTYRDATIKSNIWDALLFAFVDGLSSISMALLLWYGSGGLFGEVATAGLLAAFIEFISRIFRPIREFSQKLAVIQRAAAAMEKIFEILDEDDQISAGSVEVSPESFFPVVMKDVSFAYGGGPDVLKGVSLRIEPGQTIALVGRTGSGKSTIGKLLTRTYQGYRGEIQVNNTEISALTAQSVQHGIGAVQQDTQLFPGTVRFNLTLGAEVEDARITEAIELCGATALVARLGGLDGVIEHRGLNVSVGEGQLLSFARTLISETPVVILDEATASVDSLTEAAIQRATEALLARRTVLVIAHRLSTIKRADEILVMEAGRVIERGTHLDLLAQQGSYASMFNQSPI